MSSMSDHDVKIYDVKHLPIWELELELDGYQ